MKNRSQLLSRLASIAVLTLLLICSVAWLAPRNSRFAATAQNANSGSVQNANPGSVQSANPGSCDPPPSGSLTQAQVAQFDSVAASLNDKETQANHDYANGKLRCKADPKPSACIMTVQKKFQNAETDIQEDRDENDANRQKAEIDAGAARDQCNVTGQTPAEKQENLRHFQALIGFQKQNVDIQLKYNIAKLNCQIYSEPGAIDNGGAKSSDKSPADDYNHMVKPGSGCVSAAEKQYQADQINLQADTNDENFLHTKNLTAIQKQQSAGGS